MAYHYDLLRLLQVPQMGAQRIGRLLAELNFAEFCHYDKLQLKQIGWNESKFNVGLILIKSGLIRR